MTRIVPRRAVPRRAVPRRTVLAGLAGVLPVLSACGPEESPRRTARSAAPAAVTVESCAGPIHLDSVPRRVVVLGADPLPLLHAVGALDTVVGWTGPFARSAYPDELGSTIAQLPRIDGEVDSTGHTVVSQEIVVSLEPDLVLSSETAVDITALSTLGIPVHVAPAFCSGADLPDVATFDLVHRELKTYGALFAAPERAQTARRELDEALTAVPQAPAGARVAALYPSGASGPVYGYGSASMNHAIIRAAGAVNVWADVPERVFEAGREDLLARRPTTIVLLYDTEAPEKVVEAFRAGPLGTILSRISEVRLIPLPFADTDPPTPLSAVGAQRLGAALAQPTAGDPVTAPTAGGPVCGQAKTPC